MFFAIAVDGPAGAGKSTISKLLAKKLGVVYIDTGAMYRAMAVYMMRNQIDGDDRARIAAACQEAEVQIRLGSSGQRVLLNHIPKVGEEKIEMAASLPGISAKRVLNGPEDVTDYLRDEAVGNMASKISRVPEVRERLVALQRSLAKEASVVMDGRDIGTVVLPDAQLKVYLTADAKVRALRRYEELKAKGEEGDLEKIEADILERDRQDMEREVSPLRKAEDAILVDSSSMTNEEVVNHIMNLCTEKGCCA